MPPPTPSPSRARVRARSPLSSWRPVTLALLVLALLALVALVSPVAAQNEPEDPNEEPAEPAEPEDPEVEEPDVEGPDVEGDAVRAGRSITVFHNLDFVALAGYERGDDMLVRVLRAGVEIGRTEGRALETPEGVGLEINHGVDGVPQPGECWERRVPDIRPFDVIEVTDETGVDRVHVDDIRFTGPPFAAGNDAVLVPFAAFYADRVPIPVAELNSAEFREGQLRYESTEIRVEPRTGGEAGPGLYWMRYTAPFQPARNRDLLTSAQVRSLLLSGNGHAIGYGHVEPAAAKAMLVDGIADVKGPAAGCPADLPIQPCRAADLAFDEQRIGRGTCPAFESTLPSGAQCAHTCIDSDRSCEQTCQKTCTDGVWSTQAPLCLRRCPYPTANTLPAGLLPGTCAGATPMHGHGGTCLLQLRPGFRLSAGSAFLTCRDGVRSPMPTVVAGTTPTDPTDPTNPTDPTKPTDPSRPVPAGRCLGSTLHRHFVSALQHRSGTCPLASAAVSLPSGGSCALGCTADRSCESACGRMQCMDGVWSGTPAQCKKRCTRPTQQELPQGALMGSCAGSTTLTPSPMHGHGESCVMGLQAGWQLAPGSIGKLALICQDGQLSPMPTLQPISKPQPQPDPEPAPLVCPHPSKRVVVCDPFKFDERAHDADAYGAPGAGAGAYGAPGAGAYGAPGAGAYGARGADADEGMAGEDDGRAPSELYDDAGGERFVCHVKYGVGRCKCVHACQFY